MPPEKRGKKKREKKEKESLSEHAKVVDKKIDKQVVFLLGAIAFVFAMVFVFIYVYNHAADFTYKGLKFTKTNMNGLILYETNLQLTRPDGVFRYPLQLRNDPR